MATIRNRTIYKTSFVQGSALLVGALCAIFSYPLWGLVVGYTFALTAVQVAGDEGAQMAVEPGPAVLFTYAALSFILAVGAVGIPMYLFVVRRIKRLKFFR